MAKTFGSHRLTSLSVVGGFLDGLTIHLSEGLNCLIGARGTGKTTVMEFVRYAMDALPADAPNRRRVEALVEKNLGGGRIDVAVQTRDGLSYIVRRAAGDQPVVLDAAGRPTDLNLRSGRLFKVDIFSQNEVEAIADRAGSQLNLLDNFETERIAEVGQRIEAIRVDLRANAARTTPLRRKATCIAEELKELEPINERLGAFVEHGGDDAEAINQGHALKALRDRERRMVSAASDLLAEARQAVAAGLGLIQRRLCAIMTEEMLAGPNGELMAPIRGGFESCSTEVDEALGYALERIDARRQGLETEATTLDLRHKEQDIEFQALMAKHKEAQGKAAERQGLEKQRNELLARQQDRAQMLQQLEVLAGERRELLCQQSELLDERFRFRQEIVDRINAALEPTVVVSLTQYGNPEAYRVLLEDALRGHRMKQNIVANRIVTAFWPEKLVEVVHSHDTQALIDKAGLNHEQAEKVMAALRGSDTLYELEVVELADLPRIELNDNGTYKETGSLSTGQKCTTILSILLMDSENPLLIDQPEDNLDNRFVFETIVDSISRIKQRRQLLFVTHNPNIPVLGDADRVFVMESDGTTARILNQGGVEHCKDHILTLLEGGEDAFRRRGVRYGS